MRYFTPSEKKIFAVVGVVLGLFMVSLVLCSGVILVSGGRPSKSQLAERLKSVAQDSLGRSEDTLSKAEREEIRRRIDVLFARSDRFQMKEFSRMNSPTPKYEEYQREIELIESKFAPGGEFRDMDRFVRLQRQTDATEEDRAWAEARDAARRRQNELRKLQDALPRPKSLENPYDKEIEELQSYGYIDTEPVIFRSESELIRAIGHSPTSKVMHRGKYDQLWTWRCRDGAVQARVYTGPDVYRIDGGTINVY